jgi:hypothetical protein
MTSKCPGISLTGFFNNDHVKSLIYLPPAQPALTSHAVAPCLYILSANIAAYLLGWSMMKAAPMPLFITLFSNPSVCILEKKNVRSWGELDEVAQVRIPALAHLPCL